MTLFPLSYLALIVSAIPISTVGVVIQRACAEDLFDSINLNCVSAELGR